VAPVVFKLDGLVLSETNVGEADKMLTVLTKERGKMAVRAFGVRSHRHKLLGTACKLCFINMDIGIGKGGYRLADAGLVNSFRGVRSTLEGILLAQYIGFVADELTDIENPDDDILSLTLNALYAIDQKLYDLERIKYCFELRAMVQTGYAPELAACSRCGKDPDNDGHMIYFDVHGGTVCCADCRAKMSEEAGRKFAEITYPVLLAMRHIIGCPIKRLFSFKLEKAAEHILAETGERFICERFEFEPKTLTAYKELPIAAPIVADVRTKTDNEDQSGSQ